MPELRIKEVRLPELHLPEMSRDDISRVIGRRRATSTCPGWSYADGCAEVGLTYLGAVEDRRAQGRRRGATGKSLARAGRSCGRIVGVTGLTAVVARQPPVRPGSSRLPGPRSARIDESRARDARRRRPGRARLRRAVAVPVEPSAFADDAPVDGSPYDGRNGLPEGFGAEQTAMPPAEDATRV